MVIFQTFNRLMINLAFKANQDYIAANFCENKDKPEKHCNGRCILVKKLKQAEQNEEKQRTENLAKTALLYFCKIHLLAVGDPLSDLEQTGYNPFYLNFKPSFFANDIFKPPQRYTC
ncbi:hypothetical protein AQ505_16335 [Pedobacter sp. PACM 27299]|nr:hypothetical protein AQ505_16335 [Pedobacter sp. PACM 27299]